MWAWWEAADLRPMCVGFCCRYVADSESSSLRLLDVRTGGSTLVVGGDALFADNLFRFGDRDGPNAVLQHPLGVACAGNGDVYIADSYNHKIKKLSGQSKTAITVAGTGTPGFADGPGADAQFSEPGGLAVLQNGDVLIADTNNSVIRKLTPLPAGARVSTLQLQDVPPVTTSDPIGQSGSPLPPGTKLVRTEPVTGSRGIIRIRLSLAEGFHLTVGARSTWLAVIDVPSYTTFRITSKRGEFDVASVAPVAELLYSGGQGMQGAVRVQLAVYFCRDGDVCLLDDGVVEIPVQSPGNTVESQDLEVVYRVSRQRHIV